MAPSKLLATTSFRLFLAYLALFGLTSAAVVGAIFWRTNDMMVAQVLQVIAAEARGLREQFQVGGLALLAETVAERSRAEGSSLYVLVDPSGRKIAGNVDRLPDSLARQPNGGVFRYAPASAPGNEARLGIGVPIPVAGGAILMVGRDVEEQQRFTDNALRIFLLGFGLTALIALAGAVMVSRRLLARVDAVTAASRAIMAGNLAQRLPVRGSDDEIDRLSTSLNEMLERIEQLLNGLREVSDNIAHDLRTPLTRLRNRAEAALRDPGGAAAFKAGLESTIEEADELIKTFNALLAIARLEAGAGTETLARHDLAEVLRDVAELYEPVLEEAGLRLDLEIGAEIAVRADRQLLGQTIANLLDNAIKYAGPAMRAAASETGQRPAMTIALERHGEEAHVIVADRGPGIAPQDRERALRRFVRLEASRTQPGSGLGLSLVAAVMRLHGGSVRLADNAPGLAVILCLPVAAPAASMAFPSRAAAPAIPNET